MISKQLTFTHLYNVLRILYSCIFLVFAFACVWLIYAPFRLDKLSKFYTQTTPHHLPKTGSLIDFNTIGEGALEVSSELKHFPLPDPEKEMFFWGKNTRPDATIYDLLIHVGLKSSGQSLRAVSGQKLYLTYVRGVQPRLEFSSTPTPLWIMPYLSETGETLVELGARLFTDKCEKLIEESKTFEIDALFEKTVSSSSHKDLNFQEAVLRLQQGMWWDPDLLFGSYGGEKYQKLKKDQRLELSNKNQTYLVHVKEGDHLVWEGDRWKHVELGEHSRGIVLARIRHIAPHRMDIEAWNGDGIETAFISHAKKTTSLPNFQVDNVFSSLRQRTKSRVSCRIENKASVVKMGDWIFHTSKGWHVLKSLEQIEEVLTFRSKGELFVFDGIEKEDGKSFFIGTLFDSMRTQYRKVKILMAADPKPLHSSHKKKIISSKIDPGCAHEDVVRHVHQVEDMIKYKEDERSDMRGLK